MDKKDKDYWDDDFFEKHKDDYGTGANLSKAIDYILIFLMVLFILAALK